VANARRKTLTSYIKCRKRQKM